MKFRVRFKDPDTLHDAISDAVQEGLTGGAVTDKDEREALSEVRRDKLARLCSRWFEYSEYLEVEIDTEAETCTVVPVKA